MHYNEINLSYYLTMEKAESPKDYINKIDQEIRNKLKEKGIDPKKQRTVLTVGYILDNHVVVKAPEDKILPRIKTKK